MFCTAHYPTSLSLGLGFLISTQEQKTCSRFQLKTKTVQTARRGSELKQRRILVNHLAISYSQNILKLAVKNNSVSMELEI
jgi:hypothetical protein